MFVTECCICRRVRPCEWLEDPNTGDGDFFCLEANCEPEGGEDSPT